jgi:hypothetical protein
MKSFFGNIIRGLPALLGIGGGVVLFVVNTSSSTLPSGFVISGLIVIVLVIFLLFSGRKIIGKHPQAGRILIDFWILLAITISMACTFLILKITVTTPGWFPKLDIEQSKAVSGMIVGSVTTFLATQLTKDIAEGKGFFWPSAQFKSALQSAFRKGTSVPPIDTKEWEAIYEERVRGASGPQGWGYKARTKRAKIISDYLKGLPTTPKMLPQDTRDAEIKRLEQLEVDSILKGDSAALFDKIWSSKMIVMTINNEIETIEETKAQLASGNLNYLSFERTIEKITFNDNVAVVMGGELIKPRDDQVNARRIVSTLFTHVWLHKNNSWSIIAKQATIIKIE